MAKTDKAKPAKSKKATAQNKTKLSSNQKKVLEVVETMNVLELLQLVKALEDKFGVSAAAPVAAVAAPAQDAKKEDEEEKSIFNVILKTSGDQKIAVIKAVKAITGLGLKEAKELVDGAPKAIKEDVKKEEAEDLKKLLEKAGATVELK